MTIRSPNLQTRFPAAVGPILAERRAQYALMDIGARGSVQKVWAPLRDISDIIGFEPEPIECERLNRQLKESGQTRVSIHPTAIAGTNGPHTFYVTQYPDSSGLYRAHDAWLGRMPFTTLKVARELSVNCVTLDQFCADAALDHVDFIKIDVEGAEYDVLSGGREMLRTRGVLGIFTEFWWDPVIKGQRGFADIDIYLRGQGMRFFDLDLHRYPRGVLPAGRLVVNADSNNQLSVDIKAAISKRTYGQAWTGDALYFRDPVGELRAGTVDPMWNRDRLLRLCGLLDLYDYGDCALEILDAFRDTLLAGVNVDALMDALVPPVDGKLVTYDAYRAWSVQARQIGNKQAYRLEDWQPPPTGYRPKQ